MARSQVARTNLPTWRVAWVSASIVMPGSKKKDKSDNVVDSPNLDVPPGDRIAPERAFEKSGPSPSCSVDRESTRQDGGERVRAIAGGSEPGPGVSNELIARMLDRVLDRLDSPSMPRLEREPAAHDARPHEMSDSDCSDDDDDVDCQDGDSLADLGAVFGSPLIPLAQASPPSVGDIGFQRALAGLEELFDGEADCGPPLDAKYAGSVNGALRKRPVEAVITALMSKYKRPDNLPNLQVPKTNGDVWKVMHQGPRMCDLVLQKAQLVLSKGLIPLVSQVNGFCTADARGKETFNVAECIDAVNDAARLFISAFNYVSQARKELVRNDIRDKRFVSLCSWDTPVGVEFLFQDLPKLLQEAEASSKLAIGQKHRTSTPGPSGSGSFQRSFREKSRGQKRFHGGNAKKSRQDFQKAKKPAKKD